MNNHSGPAQNDPAWDIDEIHLQWEFYERKIELALKNHKPYPPAPPGYPGVGWQSALKTNQHSVTPAPVYRFDGPAPIAPLATQSTIDGYPNLLGENFAISQTYQNSYPSPESLHHISYSRSSSSTSTPNTLDQWGVGCSIPTTPESLASTNTLSGQCMDVSEDSQEAITQVPCTQAEPDEMDDGDTEDITTDGYANNQAPNPNRKPLHIEDVPDWFPVPVLRAEAENTKAPTAIVRDAQFLLLKIEEMTDTPMFEVDKSHPRDRYKRPLFFTIEKKMKCWRLWGDLSPAVQLAYRMGCPPPGNRSEILRRRKLISNKIMLVHNITLCHPMRFYLDQKISEGVVRPCVHTIYKLIGQDYGWDKQLCLDVMTSICNDNHHNQLQLERTKAMELAKRAGEHTGKRKNTNTSSENPSKALRSIQDVNLTSKRKGKGLDPHDSQNSLDDVDNTRRPPKRQTITQQTRNPHSDDEEDITHGVEHEEAHQLKHTSTGRGPSNSRAETKRNTNNKSVLTKTRKDTDTDTFVVQVFEGEKLHFNVKGTYSEFLKYMRSNVEFPPGVDMMWYRNPNDKEWSPLGYEAEWEGLLHKAGKGIIEWKLDSQKEWPNSESESTSLSVSEQFLPKISRLPQRGAPPAVKKPPPKATSATKKPPAKTAAKKNTNQTPTDIVKETPIKRRPGRPPKKRKEPSPPPEPTENESDEDDDDEEEEEGSQVDDTQSTRRSRRVQKPSKASQQAKEAAEARGNTTKKQKMLKDAKKAKEAETTAKRPAIEA